MPGRKHPTFHIGWPFYETTSFSRKSTPPGGALYTDASQPVRGEVIAFGRNHIAGPIIRNIFPNRPGTISPTSQYSYSRRFWHFSTAQWREVNRGHFQRREGTPPGFPARLRQREVLCSARLSYGQPPYPPFFRHLCFHASVHEWSLCSASPYPRPQTVRGIPLPECRNPAIWRLGYLCTNTVYRPPVAHATAHPSGRFRAFRWAWFDYPSVENPAFPFLLVAASDWFIPIVLLWTHIVSCS